MAEIELEDQPATTTEAPTKKRRKPRKPKTEATPEPQDVQEATQEVQGEADATQNVQSTVETAEAAQNASQTASAKSDELTEADEFERRLKSADDKIREADVEIESLKSKLKSAKARQEEYVGELREIVRQGRHAGQSMPLFDRQPEPAPKPSVKLHEPWREWSLAKIGLSDSIVEKLAEAGYSTAGQIAGFSSKGGILTDIAGIGEATADKIDDALAEMHRIKPWEVDGSVDVATAMLSLGPEGMRLEDSAGDEEPSDESEPETEGFDEDELD